MGGNEGLNISQTVRQHGHALFALEQIAQVRRQMQCFADTSLTHRIRELDRVSGT